MGAAFLRCVCTIGERDRECACVAWRLRQGVVVWTGGLAFWERSNKSFFFRIRGENKCENSLLGVDFFFFLEFREYGVEIGQLAG